MKKKFIMLLSFLLLCSCNNNANSENKSINNQTDSIIPISEDDVSLTEQELVGQSELFQNAIKMNETFIINGVEASVVKADTSIIYAGNNKNKNLMGVYIYIDYPSSNCLESDLFTVIDINGNSYNHLTDDGLDFLGKNRGEKGNTLGYYRVSLPSSYSNYLLMFEQNGKNEYVHFIVEREDLDEN